MEICVPCAASTATPHSTATRISDGITPIPMNATAATTRPPAITMRAPKRSASEPTQRAKMKEVNPPAITTTPRNTGSASKRSPT